jgi:DNA-binding NarL/FixJ family response regulator
MAASLATHPDIAVLAAVPRVEEALRVIRKHHPLVTLVDLAALGGHGPSRVADIRAVRPATSVLVVGVVDDQPSSLTTQPWVVKSGEPVRLGRIRKHAPADELVAAVRAAGRRVGLKLVPPGRWAFSRCWGGWCPLPQGA